MRLDGEVSGFVKNFNIGIFSDTIYVINVSLSVSMSQQCCTVLIENFIS